MSIFKYTLASGDNFTLRAPAGTTQGQADSVFYSQVAAGSLVGYAPGQTLTSAFAQSTKFQLSRLDRGSAGVDDIAVLSVISGLPVISATLPSSINTALSNPVNAGNVIGIVSDSTGYNNGSNLNAPAIGPLSSAQVQAVQAQIINFVNQPANTITVPGAGASGAGVGQYGFTAQQLEQSGYLKPGISEFITNGNESITGPTDFPINTLVHYDVTGVPNTTFSWQSIGSSNPNGFTQGGPFTFDGNGTILPIFTQHGIPGTYQYYGFFSTGHTFTWTMYVPFVGKIGPNYTKRTAGNFVQVLDAPGVWTGKDGINSLNNLLASPLVQNIAQTTLMQNAYSGLTATGVIQPPVTQPSISQGQIYTQTGLQQVSAVSLAINSALAVPGVVQSSLSNFPIVALTSAAVAVTDTLASGAIDNLNTGAYSIVSDNTSRVNSIVTGTTAALVSTASKFGTLAVNNYITQTLGSNPASRLARTYVNNAINQATNSVIRGVSSTVTGLINGTTSINQIATLAKSSDFASTLADPSTVLSSSNTGEIIESGINNVTSFVNSAGTNINNAVDRITAGNFNYSGLAQVGIGLAANRLGISQSTVNAVQTGLQVARALSTGGLSALANPGVIRSITGLLGGSSLLSSSSLSALRTVARIPGLGVIMGGLLGGGGLAGQTRQAAGFSNTVNRAIVDVAVSKILGSNKIPAPVYGYPSRRALAPATNILQAQNVLAKSNLPTQAVLGGQSIDISGPN
jgi:hypothetical protein